MISFSVKRVSGRLSDWTISPFGVPRSNAPPFFRNVHRRVPGVSERPRRVPGSVAGPRWVSFDGLDELPASFDGLDELPASFDGLDELPASFDGHELARVYAAPGTWTQNTRCSSSAIENHAIVVTDKRTPVSALVAHARPIVHTKSNAADGVPGTRNLCTPSPGTPRASLKRQKRPMICFGWISFFETFLDEFPVSARGLGEFPGVETGPRRFPGCTDKASASSREWRRGLAGFPGARTCLEGFLRRPRRPPGCRGGHRRSE